MDKTVIIDGCEWHCLRVKETKDIRGIPCFDCRVLESSKLNLRNFLVKLNVSDTLRFVCSNFSRLFCMFIQNIHTRVRETVNIFVYIHIIYIHIHIIYKYLPRVIYADTVIVFQNVTGLPIV